MRLLIRGRTRCDFEGVGMESRFEFGETVMTWNAHETLHPDDVLSCIARHAKGDWGELCREDVEANDTALSRGGRILSAYRDRLNNRFWIITEWDRSVTTVLLPSDY